VSESFFATYKKELIHTRPWPSVADVEKETNDWISNGCGSSEVTQRSPRVMAWPVK
jgi:hypothetical protein